MGGESGGGYGNTLMSEKAGKKAASMRVDWVIKILLAKGGKVDFRLPVNEGFALVHQAVMLGNLGRVKWLRRKGGSITLQSRVDGWTPLMVAARCGVCDIAFFFVKKKVGLEKRDNNGWTALHHAAFGGNPRMVKMLLFAGCLRNTKAYDGQTALEVAIKFGKRATMKILKLHPHEIIDNRVYLQFLEKNWKYTPIDSSSSSSSDSSSSDSDDYSDSDFEDEKEED